MEVLCKSLSVLAVLSCFGVPAVAQQMSLLESSESGYRISTSVDLAVFPVSVKDRSGHFISGLNEVNFRVYENGEPQEITTFSDEDLPVTAGLLIDNSSSMQGKRAHLITAALEFINSRHSEDELFVINFNEDVQHGLPPEIPFSSNVNQLRMALAQGVATGKTALCDAVAEGLLHLSKGTRDRKALIVLSDGGDNASTSACPDVLEKARRSQAVVFSVAIFDDSGENNLKILKRLSQISGGELFLPRSINDLSPICRQIASDLRSQYTIGYIPKNRKLDGGFRKVRVSVRAPGSSKWIVRTREGYFAPDMSRAGAE